MITQFKYITKGNLTSDDDHTIDILLNVHLQHI